MVRDAVQNEMTITCKSSSVDLVTKTDQKVEKLIIESVKEKFPKHRYSHFKEYPLYIMCILYPPIKVCLVSN